MITKIDNEVSVSFSLQKMGWWPCRHCSNDSFIRFHREDEYECPVCGKPKSEVIFEEKLIDFLVKKDGDHDDFKQ